MKQERWFEDGSLAFLVTIVLWVLIITLITVLAAG